MKTPQIRKSYPLGRTAAPTPWQFPVPAFPVRVVATLVDWTLLGVGAVVMWALLLPWFSARSLLTPSQILCFLVPLECFFYFGAAYSCFGTTVGKGLFRIRLERASTRARVDWGRAFLREAVGKGGTAWARGQMALGLLHSGAPLWLPGVVLCWPLWQALIFERGFGDGRGIGDRLLDTRVVGARGEPTTVAWLRALRLPVLVSSVAGALALCVWTQSDRAAFAGAWRSAAVPPSKAFDSAFSALGRGRVPSAEHFASFPVSFLGADYEVHLPRFLSEGKGRFRCRSTPGQIRCEGGEGGAYLTATLLKGRPQSLRRELYFRTGGALTALVRNHPVPAGVETSQARPFFECREVDGGGFLLSSGTLCQSTVALGRGEFHQRVVASERQADGLTLVVVAGAAQKGQREWLFDTSRLVTVSFAPRARRGLASPSLGMSRPIQ